MLILGPARLDLRLFVQVEKRYADLPIRWDATHDVFSVDDVHAETGRVPGEAVWIARVGSDAPAFVATVEVVDVLDARMDERLGVVEVTVDEGAFVIAITPDAGVGRLATDRLTLGVTEAESNDSNTTRRPGRDPGPRSQEQGTSFQNGCPADGRTEGCYIHRAIADDAVTIAIAWGSDGLHARAALFPFLAGARSRAGLQAAQFAQSSGASSST